MIIYDYREDTSGVPGLLKRLGVPTTRTELQVGDYVAQGQENIVIERKEAGDYVGSLKDGSLHTQLYELSTNYPYAILLVEGNVTRELMHRKMKRQQLISSLAGSMLKRSPDGWKGVISMVNLDTAWDTALFLQFCHEKVTKEGGLMRLPVMKATKWKPEERAVGVLASFPNIGEVRAKGLLNQPRTNTLQKIMNADVETLMQAESVGEKYAKGIFELSRKVYEE